MKKNLILVHQRINTHYTLEIFQKLIECYDNIMFIYGQPNENETLKNAHTNDNQHFKKVKNVYFSKKSTPFISSIFIPILRMRPNIIITVNELSNLNILFLYLLRFVLKFKIILWGMGYDVRKGFHPETDWMDKVRLKFYQSADAAIFYWDRGFETVAKYSKKTDHYFIAPNTLNTDKLFNLKSKLDEYGKDNIKIILGIEENNHFIYVGRLLEYKEIDKLLLAFKIIQSKGHRCRLTIIGDGPEKNKLQDLCMKLSIKTVHFLGEILENEETGRWIYISDAFVMPGWLGLSVVHSFCFGTPVISQKRDLFHAEGIDYLENGINGFLVEDGNIQDLANKMELFITNKEIAMKLRKAAFETVVNRCTIDKMIDGFKSAIRYADESRKGLCL